jgi:hypothetical protein
MGANAVALNATRHATRTDTRKENLAMVLYYFSNNVACWKEQMGDEDGDGC